MACRRVSPSTVKTLASGLGPGGCGASVHASRRFNLDFDDAYQYVAAEKYNLIIVSFDGDFDRIERGRRIPMEVLQG